MLTTATLFTLGSALGGTMERIEVHGRAPAHNANLISIEQIYQPGMTLVQVLRHVPGLYVRQAGGPGGELGLSLDGSASAQVLVLLDGEPLTSSTLGSPLLQHLDPAEIASVEVVHGAAGASYGAGAMAGVLHIRTHAEGPQVVGLSRLQGHAPDEADGRGWHGYLRLNTAFNSRTQAAVSLGKRSENTALARRDTSPQPGANFFNPDYTTEHASVDFNRAGSGNRKWRLSHRYQGSNADYAQDCVAADSFQPVPCQPWLKSRQHLTRVEQSRQWASRTARWSLSYLSDDATSFDHLDSAANWSGFGERYSTQRWRTAYSIERQLSRGGRVTRGLEWQREYAKSNQVVYQQQSRARFAVFNQYVSAKGSGLGVRAERLGSGSWVVSGDVQQALQLSDRTQGVLKLSNGYREPSFNDLFWPGAGNAELRRERSLGIQFELQHSYAQGQFRVRPFYQRWRDLIAWAPLESGSLWAPQNVAKASSVGTAFSLTHQLNKRLQLDASLTLQNPRDDEQRSRLLLRPRQLAHVQLNYVGEKWTVGLAAHGRDAVRDSAGETIAGFVSYSATAEWQLREALTVSVQAHNLSNHQYSEGGDWFAAGRQLRLALVWRY